VAATLWFANTPTELEPLTILPRVSILPGSMPRLFVTNLPMFRSAMRFRRDLVIENLALRQQLATMVSLRRPVIRRTDRPF
jgi:hypothetical protein